MPRNVDPELRRVAGSLEEAINIIRRQAGYAAVIHMCGGTVTAINVYGPDDDGYEDADGEIHYQHVWDDYKKMIISAAGLAGTRVDSDEPGHIVDANNVVDERAVEDFRLIQSVALKIIGPYSTPCHPDFDLKAYVNEAYTKSWKLLKENRSVFDELVELLSEGLKLTRADFYPILSKLPKKRPRSSLYTWRKTYRAVDRLLKTNPEDLRLALHHAAVKARDTQVVKHKADQECVAAARAMAEVIKRMQFTPTESQPKPRRGTSVAAPAGTSTAQVEPPTAAPQQKRRLVKTHGGKVIVMARREEPAA
jgi:hypothetical protein